MIGGNDNESFVWMLLIEIVCHLHGIVHVNQFGDKCKVVGMACPVYLAAFYHHEKSVLLTLLLHQEVNTRTSDVSKREISILTVEGIRYAIAVGLTCLFALQQNHLFSIRSLILIVGIATGNGKTLAVSLFIQGIAIRIFGISGDGEIRTGIEVIGALNELLAYGVLLVALLHMCIEGCRSGMVDSHTGGDAHSSS